MIEIKPLIWKERPRGVETSYNMSDKVDIYAINTQVASEDYTTEVSISIYSEHFHMDDMATVLNMSDFDVEYVSKEHKLYDGKRDCVIHTAATNSVRDSKIYAEIFILKFREFLETDEIRFT